jgi:hypothetical protein
VLSAVRSWLALTPVLSGVAVAARWDELGARHGSPAGEAQPVLAPVGTELSGSAVARRAAGVTASPLAGLAVLIHDGSAAVAAA